MNYKDKDLLRNKSGEPIPQSWSDDIGDFVPTRIDDRLTQIENTQQQILDRLDGTFNTDFSGNVNIENAHIDNTPENPLYTQVTGSIVEKLVIDKYEIRDTDLHTFDVDVSKYKSINLFAYSDHDNDLTINFRLQRDIGTASSMTYVYDHESSDWMAINATTLSRYINYYLNSRYTFLNNYQAGLIRIELRAESQAPTTGNVRVLLTGEAFA